MKYTAKTKFAYDLLHKGTLALSRAERQGIRVDVDYIRRKKEQLGQKIERMKNEFRQTKFYRHWEHTSKSRINMDSDIQLANFLYNVKKLTPIKFTKTGRGAADEQALSQLGIKELDDLLRIRKFKNLRDTYLEAFLREQVNGYLHPSFNLNTVVTFRSSSNNPNFQNIPKRDEQSMKIIRRALYPRLGHQLLEVDYSGLEVRIAACYHKDPKMIEYINNSKSDMHRDMAQQIFFLDTFDKTNEGHKKLRGAAKNGFVFPQFYGDYYGNCAENMACEWGGLSRGKWTAGQGIRIKDNLYLSDLLKQNGIHSFDSFAKHVKEIEYDFWHNRFPDYSAWKERHWKAYVKNGYFTMKTGFTCSGIMNKKEVINYPVQGSAFHCLLWSFIELDDIMRRRQWRTRMIGQIHDSILLDVHPSELTHVIKTIKKATCIDLPRNWNWITVPLGVDMELCEVDNSWADKKEFEL